MYKLLLVDDEAIIREGILNMISWEQLGIKVTASCTNAFEALDSMVDEVPDILLCDIKMPGMNGLELVGNALKIYPLLQTIVLSGYDEFEYARKAIKLGVKEYLLKPCDKEELNACLVRVCGNLKKQHKKVSEKMDDRSRKIKNLMEQLKLLGANEEDIQQLADKTEQTILAEGCEEVLVETLVSLVAESAKKTPDAQLQMEMIQSIYSQESHEMLRCAARILHQICSMKGKRRRFVEEMCMFVQEHYMEQSLSLQYIADNVVHMNADYIGKEFARDCGMKFSKYLLRVRIEHAKRMIREESTMPFYEIAEKTGYGDNPQYFSSMFKKECNMTPKEYRDKFNEEGCYCKEERIGGEITMS